MELQELTCRALIANVRFRLSPTLADNRGAMIRELGSIVGTEEFGWTETGIDLFSSDQRDHFRLTGRDLVASSEHFESIDDSFAKTKAFTAAAVAALQVEEFAFLGVRTLWLAATDDFDALRDGLVDRFGATMAELGEVAGKRPTDVGWVYEFHGSDPRITVRMGPMKVEQALEMFRVKDASLYPPEFLFLDLDRFMSDDSAPIDRLEHKLDRAIDRNLELAARFGRYFSGLETP